MGLVTFDVRTPLADAEIRDHIRHVLSLSPTQFMDKLEGQRSNQTLRVIANGPSAEDAPLNGPTLALNGALGAILAKGKQPTFWACCDPQELVVDFLDIAPVGTTYYVASKCHPKVFDRLRNHDVRVFHLEGIAEGLNVPHTSTITMTAMNLFRMLGWKKFEVWGWDACYLNGKHHANEPGRLLGGLGDITCHIGDRKFETRQAWACEAEEAHRTMLWLESKGPSHPAYYTVDIKGDGMIGAYMKELLK